jgi:predicted regulator of Ras-like GTPase activity (Roadblock/LC7/MglB family)
MQTYVVVPPADLSHALREELLSFRSLTGWVSSAVTRRDGLSIQHTFSSNREAANMCAMAASLVGSARATGTQLDQGAFRYAIVHYAEGLLVVTEAGAEAILACLLDSATNLGLALLKIQRVAGNVATRLGEI